MMEYGVHDSDLLFTPTAGTGLSRNDFRRATPAFRQSRQRRSSKPPSTTCAPRTHPDSSSAAPTLWSSRSA